MCTVSMIGDHYNDLWKQKPFHPNQWPYGNGGPGSAVPQVTRQEFEDLKRQVLEMKELLKRAKEYDERNNEPECEVEEKMAILRKVAEMVGISLDDVIGNSKGNQQ